MSYLPDLKLNTFVSLTDDHIPMGAWKTWIHNIDQLPICHPTKGPWIAGGAVRRFLLEQDPWCADIDYFCQDLQQFHLLCSRLESMGAHLSESTEHHQTYRVEAGPTTPTLTIQVVRSRFCPTLHAHLDQFDFTICQTGWNGEHFILSMSGILDMSTKTVNCTGVFHAPAHSWTRLLKYYTQGFTPSQTCIATLLTEAQKVHDTSTAY